MQLMTVEKMWEIGNVLLFYVTFCGKIANKYKLTELFYSKMANRGHITILQLFYNIEKFKITAKFAV